MASVILTALIWSWFKGFFLFGQTTTEYHNDCVALHAVFSLVAVVVVRGAEPMRRN